jgi:trans-2-enoyl-CoA reductase
VRFPGEGGAWQASACIAVDELLTVPAEVPVEQAAISFINPPTAYCLLKKIVDLAPGDWVLQNAGNSAVGLSVIQMAKRFGLKTISQVRREELVEPLRAMGADHVVMEGTGWAKGISEITRGAPVKLALNSIGGESAMDQIKALGDGGTQVTFGGMVGDKVRFPTRFLIFNDVCLRGFWWDQFARREGIEGVRQVMDEVYSMMAKGDLKLPIEQTYSFADFKEAIEHANRPRLGKVLLKLV